MTLIIDLQYFPSFILYKSLYNFSNIVFEQYESYQKMSFRNRCQIVGAEGVIDLSIPLVRGRDQKALMKDVRISAAQPWQSRHWKTIVSCYNRSPWFDYYRDELEGLYRKPCEFLVDWNLMCFEWTVKVLAISTPVSLTGGYEKGYAPDRVTDWRGKILPKQVDVSLGAPVHSYRQVFEERIGFIPNLSVLDLLFCEGKQAIRYLQSF
jgi:WbqC-like protein family